MKKTNKTLGFNVVAVGYEVPNEGVDMKVYATREAANKAIKLWMLDVAACCPDLVESIEKYGVHDRGVQVDFYDNTECSYIMQELTVL
jgi:hypothetical protein